MVVYTTATTCHVRRKEINHNFSFSPGFSVWLCYRVELAPARPIAMTTARIIADSQWEGFAVHRDLVSISEIDFRAVTRSP